MEGEQQPGEDHNPFNNFQEFTRALDEDNFNVSISEPLTLPPLPQRISKISRSNQNQKSVSTEYFSTTYAATASNSSLENEAENNLFNTKNKLSHTTSAPFVTPNNSSKKRTRSKGSSSTSATSKPVYKKSGSIANITSNNFRVSFAPQVNHNSDTDVEVGMNVGTSTSNRGLENTTSTTNAKVYNKDAHDMATGPNDKPERIIVNTLAKPMWDVTRQHLISQQKAHLRAVHLGNLLSQDIIPVEFHGAELLKRYYATNNGLISEDMQALIGRQAREKAELVHKELNAQAEKESRNATYFAGLTSQIYEHEGDDGFNDANVALQKVVTFYQKTETDRLEILEKKETERQPSNETEWTNLVCQPLHQPTRPDRSGSRGRKRQRNGSSGKRTNPTPQTAPAPPPQGPTPSNSYIRGGHNGPQVNASTSRGNVQQPRNNQNGAQGNKPQQHQQGNANKPRNNYRGSNPQPQRHQNPQGYQNYGNQQQQQPPRRNENQQPRNENRPGPSRPAQASNSTNKMMAAIAALKEAMKD